MKNNKIITASMFILLMAGISVGAKAFAADALAPTRNTEATPIAGETDNNVIIPLKVTDNGVLMVDAQVTASAIVTPAPPPSSYASLASDNASSVKGSSGVVISASALNFTGSSIYLLLHNKATSPVAADVPALAFVVGANQQSIIGTDFFTTSGVSFGTGIGYCLSDNALSCDPIGASDAAVFINYE
jgi:hypothetical protein